MGEPAIETAENELSRAFRYADAEIVAGSDPEDILSSLLAGGLRDDVALFVISQAQEGRADSPPPPVQGEVAVAGMGAVHLVTSDAGLTLGSVGVDWTAIDAFAHWATSTTVNGIRTDSSWYVAFTAGGRKFDIHLKEGTFAGRERLGRDQGIWAGLITVLHFHVGRRLVVRFLQTLEQGGSVAIGKVSVTPSGLTTASLLGKPKYLTWDGFADAVTRPDRVAILSRKPNGKTSQWASMPRSQLNAAVLPLFLANAANRYAPAHSS